jgi:hypothetical protein
LRIANGVREIEADAIIGHGLEELAGLRAPVEPTGCSRSESRDYAEGTSALRP